MIHNVDCFEYMRTVPDGTFDLVLTDPPYGATACGWDKLPNIESMWRELLRIGKHDCVFVFTAQQPFESMVVSANMKMFRHQLVWIKNTKTGFMNAKRAPMRQHENILVFSKKATTYNPQMTVADELRAPIGSLTSVGTKRSGTIYGKIDNAKYHETGMRYPTSVLRFDAVARRAGIHPTQKPLDLFRWLLRTYSNPGANVFDPYSGSGTTAHACMTEGRKYEACELDETYYRRSVERITAAQSQQTIEFKDGSQ
jgi:site-specific DNA-methyltransferase (adenine-specific)